MPVNLEHAYKRAFEAHVIPLQRGQQWPDRPYLIIVYGQATRPGLLRSGGLKVRLAQGNCVGEFEGKGSGRVFDNDQR